MYTHTRGEVPHTRGGRSATHTRGEVPHTCTSSTWEDCCKLKARLVYMGILGRPELTVTQERGGRKNEGREERGGDRERGSKQLEVGDTPYNPNTQTQTGNSRAQGPVRLNHTVSFRSTRAT